MNDKDKEAFVKYMGENLPYSYYVSYYCPELKTWQAACEYKHEEIKKLSYFKDVYNSLIDGAAKDTEKINELQTENKKLREALEFYANCTRLMLDVKDLPIDPIIGEPMFSSKSIMDNGDRAREALKELPIEQPKGLV
jgi:hypothetical protein